MRIVASVFIIVTVACSSIPDSRECAQSSECDLSSGGTCTQAPSGSSFCSYPDTTCASGSRWSDVAGDGLAGECVEGAGIADGGSDAAQADGGIDGGGGMIDAGGGMIDAAPADAAGPTDPPVVTGQAADLVLGQPDFTSSTANNGGQDGSSLNFPSGVASDGSRLWVGDSVNARVLQWNALPIVNNAIAGVVVGQTTATMTTNGPTQTLLKGSADHVRVFSDGTRLIVSDPGAHRVLIWTSIPTATGEAADLVLGQTTFTGELAGKSATQLRSPHGTGPTARR